MRKILCVSTLVGRVIWVDASLYVVVWFGAPIGSVSQQSILDSSVFGLLPTIQSAVQLAFDTTVFGFALFAFVRHAQETRRIQGGWLVNPLMKLLVADQMLYFLCYVVWLMLVFVRDAPNLSPLVPSLILDAITNAMNVLVAITGPRMVISLRASEFRQREGPVQMELSTIQFKGREPLTRSSVEGGLEQV
ncbi:hypothetical protein BV22DRAFT_1042181 [Leucogyrophana mollusca]|uniref:Uncharacterized protein n=1 Tax=Leucogyrophana mollusca TaxID=85980 RepID=A0ACB8AZG1_9AGAM|nr:hypothetical protein BV22DRAFT_1042181 [Leucogyrophana mollusca]